MADPFELSGKAVIVTGGTKGIGRTIAETFMRHGANVVVCGRNEPEEAIAAGDEEALFVAADVRDPGQVDALVSATTERFGGVDVLVNNAGGSPEAETATASPKFNEAIIRLNLIAPLHMAQRCNLVMQSQPDGGSIINVGSVSGIRPSPGTAAYGAAKAGLLNLTETLAVEWAPKVRVNAVVAGLIETEQAHLYYGDEAGVAAVAATIPLGRMGTPADVAAACVFLSSPLASYMSGGRLLLHGGGEVPAYRSAGAAEMGE